MRNKKLRSNENDWAKEEWTVHRIYVFKEKLLKMVLKEVCCSGESLSLFEWKRQTG